MSQETITTGETCPPEAPREADSCEACAGEAAFSIRRQLYIIGAAVLLLVGGVIFRAQLQATPYSLAEYAVFLSAYLISGWKVLYTALRNLARGKVFDENFLMTVATVGAIAIYELPEAAAVMLFFKVGELFEDLSVNRSRRSVRALLDVRPDYANLADGRRVSPEQVAVGDLIVIKPGEKIPLDGEVVEGSTLVDTSALTGEPVPRSVGAGGKVLAGMINRTGALTVRATKKFSESSVSRILEMVETATARKAPTERFITTFARYYTPAVVLGAAAVAVLPPLVTGASFDTWIYRALVLLVISCPCALVISIPLGYFGGIGGASRRGILVKGAGFLDALTNVKTVVFDKTGTLTKGDFKVSQIVPDNGFRPEELLKLAAAAEARSNHPIAQSILDAYGSNDGAPSVTGYQESPGYGVSAVVEGRRVMAGNDRMLHRHGIEHGLCRVDGTVVHVVVDDRYAGYILISDEVKPDAADAVKSLKRLGVEKVVMLTGDCREAAAFVAGQLGIDEYRADLLPEDKVSAIEELKASCDGCKIAAVGDGINDAPVIARADVGVAMGALGADAAIETADVVIMTDTPSKLAEAIQVSRRTRRVVWQNIVMALGIKGVFIALGAVGLATMWEAVFADMGVALLAILNATRTMK